MNDIGSSRKKKAPRKSFWRHRFLILTLVVLCLILSLVPIAQAASWDGSGSTPGNTDANPAVGSFWVDHADAEDIYGYRFSIYDGNGHTTKRLA